MSAKFSHQYRRIFNIQKLGSDNLFASNITAKSKAIFENTSAKPIWGPKESRKSRDPVPRKTIGLPKKGWEEYLYNFLSNFSKDTEDNKLFYCWYEQPAFRLFFYENTVQLLNKS